MTPIIHSRPDFFSLRPEDKIAIADFSYTLKKTLYGGMGCVHLLDRDISINPQPNVLGWKLALKCVRPEFANELGGKLFRRELVVWSGFRHANIVWLLEILDGGDAGWVAAMDWCMGSLRDMLDQNGSLSIADSTHVLVNLIDGLAYAYKEGKILHLDLKPENILYTAGLGEKGLPENSIRNYRFMLSDWGICAIKQPALNQIAGLSPGSESVKRTFNNMGTLRYMAPERFHPGYSSSLASDMFSLGMLYLEMLTGGLPFREETHPVAALHTGLYLKDALLLLKEKAIPKSISSLVMKLLSRTPSNRPCDYESLRREVLACSKQSQGIFARLFNYKPKRPPIWVPSSEVKHGILIRELDFLRKQVANFEAVGRSADVEDAVEEYLKKYGREAPGRVASDKELAQVCYTASYHFLPHLVYDRWEEFTSLWYDGVPFSIYLSITVSHMLGKRLSVSQVKQFSFSEGAFGNNVEYYLIEFPTPPSETEGLSTDAILEMLARGDTPTLDSLQVLGPYYAAVVEHEDSGERELYVLGQAPGGGTTLRFIDPAGANMNCGIGPPPTIDGFVRCLQNRL